MVLKLSTANKEFVAKEADKLGISYNGALNVLLAELRIIRSKSSDKSATSGDEISQGAGV